MKKFRFLLAVVLIAALLSGCGSSAAQTTDAEAGNDVLLATTYPMYYLTCRLTEGMENVTVDRMITEAVSCIHDYTLTTEQMKKIERADVIIMNGCGLEDFMTSALAGVAEENIVDCGSALTVEQHYWLNPDTFKAAGGTLLDALTARYPTQTAALEQNWDKLERDLNGLLEEMQKDQRDILCREMITFHDGFTAFADACALTVVAAIEEEEGAEPSAAELQEICNLIEEHDIPAIFVEKNGSTSAAEIIERETGVRVYTLDTIMDGQTDYITAMEKNIQTVKEALS